MGGWPSTQVEVGGWPSTQRVVGPPHMWEVGGINSLKRTMFTTEAGLMGVVQDATLRCLAETHICDFI